MSEFKVNTITNRDGSYGPQVCGITTFRSSGMQLPSGPTEFRGGRGRAVSAAGNTQPETGYVKAMEFIEIATTGNATAFGDLSQGNKDPSSCADATRGVIAGGYVSPGATNSTIEYTTISSLGGANDFGDLAVGFQYSGGCNSNVRGFFAGGWADTVTDIGGDKNSNIIQFVNIQSTGNSTQFGSLTQRRQTDQGLSSPTRGVWGGGAYYSAYPSYLQTNVIDFITFATLGDAEDFGDLTVGGWSMSAASNSTRGLFAGGHIQPGGTPNFQNLIDYITIATQGNATDFGDLIGVSHYANAAASSTRWVNFGGNAPSYNNTIQFVTISTTGNGTDFGDMTDIIDQHTAFSDVNGGVAQ